MPSRRMLRIRPLRDAGSQSGRKGVESEATGGIILPAAKQRKMVTPTSIGARDDGASALDWRLVATILVAAAVPRVVLAVEDQGIFWPDEIYQSLEQAHRAVFGYGFTPWEFRDGARSWLFPGALALLWKVAATVGVRSGIVLVLLAKLTMVAVALVGLYATIRIAGASRRGDGLAR